MTIDQYQVTDADRAEARTVLIPKGAAAPQPVADRRAKAGRGLLGWVLFTGLAVMLYVLLSKDDPHLVRRLVPSARTGAAVAVYAAGLGTVAFAVWLTRRMRLGAAARLGPSRITFTDDGITETRGAVRRLSYWNRFYSFAETQSLFVLREWPDGGQVYPKRQFADASAVDAARHLLAEKLSPPPDPAAPAAVQPAGGNGRSPGATKVEFRHTVDDFAEAGAAKPAQWRSWRRLARRRGKTRPDALDILAVLLLGMLIMAAAGIYLGLTAHRFWFFCLIVPGALIWFMVKLWGGGSRRRVRALFQSDPRLGDPWALEWDDAGLKLFASRFETHIAWAAVAGVAETKHLFIVYDPDLGYVIPKRAFAGPAGDEPFRRAIRTHAPEAFL